MSISLLSDIVGPVELLPSVVRCDTSFSYVGNVTFRVSLDGDLPKFDRSERHNHREIQIPKCCFTYVEDRLLVLFSWFVFHLLFEER